MYCKLFMVNEKDVDGKKLRALIPDKQGVDNYLRGKRREENFEVLLVNCDIQLLPVAAELNGQKPKKTKIIHPDTLPGDFGPDQL